MQSTRSARTLTTLTVGAVAALTIGPTVAASAAPARAAVPARASVPATAPARVPAATDYRNLRQGSTGSDVTMLQQDLNTWRTSHRQPALGSIGADGIFGPQTTAAVKDFQASEKLSVDGDYGPDTRTALEVIVSHGSATGGGTGSGGDTGGGGDTGSSGSGSAVAGLSSSAVLRQGDSGRQVMAWQERLNLFREKVRHPTLGMIGQDGVYGSATMAATEDLQSHAQIPVDGVAGPHTIQAFNTLAENETPPLATGRAPRASGKVTLVNGGGSDAPSGTYRGLIDLQQINLSKTGNVWLDAETSTNGSALVNKRPLRILDINATKATKTEFSVGSTAASSHVIEGVYDAAFGKRVTADFKKSDVTFLITVRGGEATLIQEISSITPTGRTGYREP